MQTPPLPSFPLHFRIRANNLGPEGGVFLAAGLAGNCGRLRELLVTDNRLGPTVATRVAGSMRGQTLECLRGFGFKPEKLTGSNPASDGDWSGTRSPSSLRGNAGGVDTQRALVSEGRQSNRNSDNRAADIPPDSNDRETVAVTGSEGLGTDKPLLLCKQEQQSQRPLHRTKNRSLLTGGETCDGSACISSVGSIVGGDNESAGVGMNGVNGEFGVTEAMAVASGTAAAIEEELGRPQTAGTASG